MATETKSIRTASEVLALLRARIGALWVVTREEARVEGFLMQAAKAAKYTPRTWDVAAGFCDEAGVPTIPGKDDPFEALSEILARASDPDAAERGVWIMRDLPPWLGGPGGARTLRQLRNLARALNEVPNLNNLQAVIVLSPSNEVPPELSNHVTVVEWPLPDRAEIGTILDEAIESMPDDLRASAAPNGQRDAAIDAAVGLSGEEAKGCFSTSLVAHKRIDVVTVANEKKRVIAREKVLEWYDPLPDGLDAVGGLEVAKAWLMARTAAFTPEARAYGLPAPKGCALIGVPGCGKTLLAKAIATSWQRPLLRWDINALKGGLVGQSEANLRKAIKVIDAIGPCVVWIDEIEKALQGATSGASDGGVSSDALGTILSWMQERQNDAFVIVTANDVEALPPELLRKGRFDETWFVDLPNATERKGVLRAALRAHKCGDAEVDDAAIAAACVDFTGAEIAALVPEALFTAFADGKRSITTADLLAVAKSVVPMSKSQEQKIAKLRKWTQEGRARSASTAEAKQDQKRARTLDLAS